MGIETDDGARKIIMVMCAKCGGPVQQLLALGCDANDDYVFVARCHGAAEITRIPKLLVLLGPVILTGGWAFKTAPEIAA